MHDTAQIENISFDYYYSCQVDKDSIFLVRARGNDCKMLRKGDENIFTTQNVADFPGEKRKHGMSLCTVNSKYVYYTYER